MSHIVHYKGKLELLYIGDDVEEAAINLLRMHKVLYNPKAAILQLRNLGTYYVTENAIYRIELGHIDHHSDIAHARANNDCSIEFEIRYNINKITLDDMITQALSNLR